MTIRRYTIHPPQLVGRLSAPRAGEDVTLIANRIVGEWDAAMQELQRFLRYLMDANDTGQTGQGIIGVTPGGAIDHGLLLGLGDDDHPHYLTVPRHAAIDAADHSSDGAIDSQVLTADGAGGAAWETIPSDALEPRHPRPHTHLGADIAGGVASPDELEPRLARPHTHNSADLLDVVTVSNVGVAAGLTLAELLLMTHVYGVRPHTHMVEHIPNRPQPNDIDWVLASQVYGG